MGCRKNVAWVSHGCRKNVAWVVAWVSHGCRMGVAKISHGVPLVSHRSVSGSHSVASIPLWCRIESFGGRCDTMRPREGLMRHQRDPMRYFCDTHPTPMRHPCNNPCDIFATPMRTHVTFLRHPMRSPRGHPCDTHATPNAKWGSYRNILQNGMIIQSGSTTKVGIAWGGVTTHAN